MDFRRPLLAVSAGLIVSFTGVAVAGATTTRVESERSPEPVTIAAASPEPIAPDPLFDDAFDFELDAGPSGFPDPAERWNRDVLGLNQVADRWVFDPVTRVYRLVPDGVRMAVRNFFDNVGSLPVLVNEVFQGRPRCAGMTLFRIAVNSTVGLAGLFDPAADMGFEGQAADFGQTLGLYGVGSGPYLVLPLFGPSTARDTVGTLVDAFFNPAAWFLGPGQQLTYGGGLGLTRRDQHYHQLKALGESSVDFYAALRNGYYQARTGHINEVPDCRRVVRDVPSEEREASLRLASSTRPCWPKGRRSCR